MPFVLNPNALGKTKDQHEIKHFLLQVVRKAQFAMELDRFSPQPITNIHWNPNCPLMRIYIYKIYIYISPRENLSFYKQIPNSSMHIFIALTSFSVPMEGRPKTSHVYSYHCFFSPFGPPLPLAYKFIS